MIPGPRSLALGKQLHTLESRNVTWISPRFPVFWQSASGSTVTDVDGMRYVDLTAAFGVANLGHSHPRVTAAVAEQAALLMHGMGDVHPTEVRVRMLESLRAVVPLGLEKVYLATTGSEAVEAALKTAMIATGKYNVAAYRGAYHGLSFGALLAGGIERFRTPFAGALAADTLLLDYPRANDDVGASLERARELLRARDDLAALLVEPIQGRGGCIVPPDGYLAGLRAVCDELGILLIFDEIYTGFGRTGTWFAADREQVVPDLMCVGKALGSGFPISATVGTARVMDAWPESSGEALHTSTYLGNPMGCAAAIATIEEHRRLDLPARAAQLGSVVADRLGALRSGAVIELRGRALCWGVQLRDAATASAVVERALALGAILLQAGPQGDVVALSPPLTIDAGELARGLDILEAAVAAVA